MNDLFDLEIGKIADLKDKMKIAFYAKIENLNVQEAVNKTDFLNLLLTDETGYTYAKKWDINEAEKKAFKIGQVVYVSGYGNEYNNKIQCIIEEIRLIDETDNVDLKTFYQSAPISEKELVNKIEAYMEKISNPNLHLITKTIINKYKADFFVFPAASRNHHAYISGLAYHVLNMLELGESIGNTYPNINMDLLYAGIILHDIGKVIELSDYLAPEYTTVGKLIGHISLTYQEIGFVARELNIIGEEVILLQHLILSHHGLLEYGSPKRPLILEAEVLHLIDLFDSRINMINQELRDTDINDFSKRVYPLDGRSFYKHNR